MAQEMHSQQPESITASGRVYAIPDVAVSTVNELAGINQGPRHLFRYRVLKRGLDIFLVIACSPVLLLLVAVIAAAIRLGSPGPIFFSHRRIRRHGAFFSMWKFRTMCCNSQKVLDDYLEAHPEARAEWLKNHKLRHDPRVTPIGNFLRRSSLDELPQLWNVLAGSMSLVGPRPIVAAEVEKYGPYFADYCRVKPGITGLWQISGRSQTSYDKRVQLDRRYARNWTFWGDLRILCKTLSSVVNQDGAY